MRVWEKIFVGINLVCTVSIALPGYAKDDVCVRSLVQYKPISKEEADQIASEYRTADFKRQKRIVEKLSLGFDKMVWSIAKREARRNPEIDVRDLYQEGMIGIQKSLKSYDRNKGHFALHVSYWINATVKRSIVVHYGSKGVIIGTRIGPKYFSHRGSIVNALEAKGSLPTPENILQEWNSKFPQLQMTLPELQVIEGSYAFRNVHSLDAPLGVDGAGSGKLFYSDIIPDEDQEDILDLVAQYRTSQKVREALAEFEQTLPPFERRILAERIIPLFSDEGEGEKLEALGRSKKLSRERVRQIQVRILLQLRMFLEARGMQFE